jgi:hypothetical protein
LESFGLDFQSYFSGGFVDKLEIFFDLNLTKNNRHFGIGGQVTELVDADVGLLIGIEIIQ